MKVKGLYLFLLIAFLIMGLSRAWAEVIRLGTGKEIEGKIIEYGDSFIRVETEQGIQRVKHSLLDAETLKKIGRFNEEDYKRQQERQAYFTQVDLTDIPKPVRAEEGLSLKDQVGRQSPEDPSRLIGSGLTSGQASSSRPSVDSSSLAILQEKEQEREKLKQEKALALEPFRLELNKIIEEAQSSPEGSAGREIELRAVIRSLEEGYDKKITSLNAQIEQIFRESVR